MIELLSPELSHIMDVAIRERDNRPVINLVRSIMKNVENLSDEEDNARMKLREAFSLSTIDLFRRITSFNDNRKILVRYCAIFNGMRSNKTFRLCDLEILEFCFHDLLHFCSIIESASSVYHDLFDPLSSQQQLFEEDVDGKNDLDLQIFTVLSFSLATTSQSRVLLEHLFENQFKVDFLTSLRKSIILAIHFIHTHLVVEVSREFARKYSRQDLFIV